MQKFFLFILIFFGFFINLQAQKSKVISVFQLIETSKFEEAKKAIEEAVGDEKTWRWPKTWYARGYLCQTAYQQGIKDNDKKKYELYPDQLYVAYESYNQALSLDRRGRYDSQIAPQYIILSNEFQTMGNKFYARKEYKKALNAFEHALIISRSPILSVEIDTNLVYNTALAAYESDEWDKAIGYLRGLDKDSYSSNVAFLLSDAYLEVKDTISAEDVLLNGLEKYEYNDTLVLRLVDLRMKTENEEGAITVLDSAIKRDSTNYLLLYTRGLVYQKDDQYENAIASYRQALGYAPEKTRIYNNLGTCYYNIGVEIEEYAMTIGNKSGFNEEKRKSLKAYETALGWFEKALNKDPQNQMTIQMIHKLHEALQIKDKIQ